MEPIGFDLKKTKKLTPEKLAEKVRPLGPVDETDAYYKALELLGARQGEVSGGDVASGATRPPTWAETDTLAKAAAALLFPKKK
jgi:hypothetical protein